MELPFKAIMDFRGYIQNEIDGDDLSCQMCGRPKKMVRDSPIGFFTHPYFGSICGECSEIWL